MIEDGLGGLTDRIYEAAIVPDLWPALLGEVAAATGSVGLVLFVTNAQQVSNWTASEGGASIIEDWVSGGWQARCRRPQRMFALKRAGWVRDLDIFTPEELEQEPDYRDFFRPRGLYHAAGTGIVLPSNDMGIFDLERTREAGPFGEGDLRFLDSLRPHLGRAALMAARLELERVRAAVAALEEIGLPAAVLSTGARLVAANKRLEAMTGQVAFRAFDRMALLQTTADALLQKALHEAALSQSPSGSSIPIASAGGHPPAVAHLLPVRGVARDIFSRGLVLFVVTPLSGPSAPSADLLDGLFDLTPSEARVARGLVEGKTLDAVAAEGHVSVSTVRNQLRAVMTKTGTSRQADLVRLLGGAALPG